MIDLILGPRRDLFVYFAKDSLEIPPYILPTLRPWRGQVVETGHEHVITFLWTSGRNLQFSVQRTDNGDVYDFASRTFRTPTYGRYLVTSAGMTAFFKVEGFDDMAHPAIGPDQALYRGAIRVTTLVGLCQITITDMEEQHIIAQLYRRFTGKDKDALDSEEAVSGSRADQVLAQGTGRRCIDTRD